MENINDRIDELEFALKDAEKKEAPVTHNFIPGYYIRTIYMPADTLVTSLIHNTEHPYDISKGIVHVKVNDEDWTRIEAPYSDITFPGTRRVIYVEEDTVWTTFHRIENSEQPALMLEEEVSEAVDKIEARIITAHENNLLGGIIRNNVLIKTIQR